MIEKTDEVKIILKWNKSYVFWLKYLAAWYNLRKMKILNDESRLTSGHITYWNT